MSSSSSNSSSDSSNNSNSSEISRSPSKAAASDASEHACPHPGCGRVFRKIGKLNRHTLIHTDTVRAALIAL